MYSRILYTYERKHSLGKVILALLKNAQCTPAIIYHNRLTHVAVQLSKQNESIESIDVWRCYIVGIGFLNFSSIALHALRIWTIFC